MGSLPHESLSDREYQVLRLFAWVRPISDIGRDSGLSVKTVSTYRARVLEKLGMRSNAELMRYAIENQLLRNLASPSAPAARVPARGSSRLPARPVPRSQPDT